MKSGVKATLWIVLALLAGGGLYACDVYFNGGPLYFEFQPVRATVVDAATKEPIEGAIVVANWQLVTGSLDGTRTKGQLRIYETRTDKDGTFILPGFTSLNPWGYEIRTEDPMIQILKDGFAVVIWRNPDYMKMFDRDPHRKSPADGHTFELEPFKGTVEAYADNLRALNVGLTFLTWSQHCEWNPHTDMVGELDRITKRLASREVRSPFPRAAELAVYPGCAEAMNRLRSAQ